MSSIPVIKFMFIEDWGVLTDALGFAPAYESENYNAAGDLTTALGMTQAGLVVAALKDKNDLIQLATLIKMVKKLSPSTFVKVIVVNFSGDKQFEKAVAKLGILDMVDGRVQTKALRFKIDFMMKSVNVHLKKMAAVQTNNTAKAVDTAKAQEKKSADLSTPQWKDALENENDIWLLKNEADCKKILTRWLVKLMGPSPYVAQWVDSNNPGVWRFDFKSEAGIFITGAGSWFYKGDQKPDFIWAENSWSFAGGAFDLFYKEGDEVVSRLSLKDKQLSIAKNSDYAKTKEQNIIESFDKDLVFKKELGGSVESDTVDKDAEIYKNLEGKGKTDSLKQNPLSGKGKTSHLNTDPMGLDLEPGDNDLSSDPLSQKGSTSHQSGFMKGKNTPEAAAGGHLSAPTGDKLNSGEELDLESKNKHQAYYKNHNEAEKFDAKDVGHAIKKDGVGDNLKGKTSTDEMEGHLRSPDTKGSAPQAKKASETSGKSFTELMDGHLRSPDGKGHSKEAPASEMDGKSATDKLAGHLKSADGKGRSKEASASEMDGKSADGKGHSKEARASEMEGKSATEKLAGYLKSANGKAAEKNNQKEATKHKNTDSNFISDDDFEEIDSPEAAVRKNADAKAGGQNKVVPIEAARKSKTFVPLEDPSKDLQESMETAVVTAILSQDLVKVKCKLDDFFDSTIIFTAKKAEWNVEKMVTLHLNFNYMGKNSSLKFNADVSQIDVDDEGVQYITVELSKENIGSFNSFMKLYAMRQQKIDYFMKSAKGY